MKKVKRIAALIGICLLAGLYLLTFISAILATPESAALFKACLFSTIFIPVMLYVYIMIYKLFHQKQQDELEQEDEKQDNSKK